MGISLMAAWRRRGGSHRSLKAFWAPAVVPGLHPAGGGVDSSETGLRVQLYVWALSWGVSKGHADKNDKLEMLHYLQ